MGNLFWRVVSTLYNGGEGGGNILLTDAKQALLCSAQLRSQLTTLTVDLALVFTFHVEPLVGGQTGRGQGVKINIVLHHCETSRPGDSKEIAVS